MRQSSDGVYVRGSHRPKQVTAPHSTLVSAIRMMAQRVVTSPDRKCLGRCHRRTFVYPRFDRDCSKNRDAPGPHRPATTRRRKGTLGDGTVHSGAAPACLPNHAHRWPWIESTQRDALGLRLVGKREVFLVIATDRGKGGRRTPSPPGDGTPPPFPSSYITNVGCSGGTGDKSCLRLGSCSCIYFQHLELR
jgi:hypothetical protein